MPSPTAALANRASLQRTLRHPFSMVPPNSRWADKNIAFTEETPP